jgi:hypothetical protein
MVKAKLTLVAALVLGALWVAAPTATAEARPEADPVTTLGWSDCPAGALCAYLSPNGDGTPGKVYNDNSNLLQYDKFNNAQSVYNNGNNCNVAIFSGTNWDGARYVLNRGYAIYNLNEPGWEPWLRNVASNDWCV